MEHQAELNALKPKIGQAIDTGCAYLMTIQNRDGSWSDHTVGSHAGSHHLGITGLCVYTLIKSNIPLDHPSVKQGLLYLQQAFPDVKRGPSGGGTQIADNKKKDPSDVKLTYDAGILLMCFHAAMDKSHDKGDKQFYYNLMSECLLDLMGGQNKGGIFSYPCGRTRKPGGGGDLSNTQYGGLGLRSAIMVGLKPPVDALEELYKGTVAHRAEIEWKEWNKDLLKFMAERDKGAKDDPEGGGTRAVPVKVPKKGMPVAGYKYNVGKDAPTHSMTTAGTALAAICLLGLQAQNKITGDKADEMKDSVEAGYFYLSEDFKADGSLYYLYGLERVGSILEREYFGMHPWYLEGAKTITKKQAKSGGWANEADTCFAILFLRRATKVITTGGRNVDLSSAPGSAIISPAGSPVTVTGSGAPELTLTISGFDEKVKAAYAGGEVKGIRIAKVEYLLDGKVVAEVKGKPAKAWDIKDKYEAEAKIADRGKHTLSAKVYVVRPEAPKDAKEPVDALEAKPASFELSVMEEPWRKRQAMARRLNLLHGVKVTAKGSTSESGGKEITWDGAKAFDGLQSSYWCCKDNDKAPTLKVDIKEAVNAKTITIGQLNRRLADANGNAFDRIKKIRLTINSMPPVEVMLDPDDMAPTYYKLERTMGIQKLEIAILDREPGKAKGKAGFTEIGLEAE